MKGDSKCAILFTEVEEMIKVQTGYIITLVHSTWLALRTVYRTIKENIFEIKSNFLK